MLKHSRKQRPGDPSDSQGFPYLLRAFQEWMGANHYSVNTVHGCETYLWKFFSWCSARGIDRPSDVTRQLVERYQRWLYHARTRTNKPLKISTQTTCLAYLRMFFRWLSRQNMILFNPTSDLVLPRQEKRLPRNVLSPVQVEEVISQADVGKPLGLRDRTIMEMLYATGMRRRELAALKIHDVDLEERTVLIREGKGGKDRLLPLGRRALAWLDKYLVEARPLLVQYPDDGTLFMSREHKAFNPDALGTTLRKYFVSAEVSVKGSCHVFRHSMATAMLDNGADIRFIQEILGHARLDTTQIYTKVSIQKLKQVHEQTHPAKLPELGKHHGRQAHAS